MGKAAKAEHSARENPQDLRDYALENFSQLAALTEHVVDNTMRFEVRANIGADGCQHLLVVKRLCDVVSCAEFHGVDS